jgi:hypothetical protein
MRTNAAPVVPIASGTSLSLKKDEACCCVQMILSLLYLERIKR